MRNIYDLCEHEYEWSNVLKKKKKKKKKTTAMAMRI